MRDDGLVRRLTGLTALSSGDGRNASNKVAVSLAADAPRVEHGTERYHIDADGQTVFA